MAAGRAYPGHEWHPAGCSTDTGTTACFDEGQKVPAIILYLARHARFDIVALANRSLEDQCVSRPSRSSSSANRPEN
jgi:hypothetical protein